jgi:hypothetical protein
VFMKDFYLPSLEAYAFHQPHFSILSKNGCGDLRNDAFSNFKSSVKTRRDYAEAVSAVFNSEIQSDHFGNNRSLSIEGSLIEFHDENGIRLEVHSHFADKSDQNAASTHAHMDVLIRYLICQGVLQHGGLMLDDTDGCAKQYRCATALFLLTLLSCVHNVTIDRAVGAPGHGKDIVDGLNAADKRYLIMKMRMIGLPEAGAEGSEENNGASSRMSAESMVEGTSKSLAVECARLCSDKARSNGVKSEGKYRKRESEAKMKQRHYHVQDSGDVSFSAISMKLTGFPASKMTRSGLRAMYNIRADPDLGMGKIALRRIPCMCHACAEQLQTPWLVNTKLTTSLATKAV